MYFSVVFAVSPPSSTSPSTLSSSSFLEGGKGEGEEARERAYLWMAQSLGMALKYEQERLLFL